MFVARKIVGGSSKRKQQGFVAKLAAIGHFLNAFKLHFLPTGSPLPHQPLRPPTRGQVPRSSNAALSAIYLSECRLRPREPLCKDGDSVAASQAGDAKAKK